MDHRAQIERAIAAQEQLRGSMPDEVVDASIDALRSKLAELSSSAPTHQRKLVTVLFADVVGFTTLGETIDPEELAELIGQVWSELDRVVSTHNGRIDKHIGDAVMAVWGAGTAREDDPEQAVRAGLEMQTALERLQLDETFGNRRLRLRIGVNTGTALLGEVGSTSEYTALGDTVNVASRLEGAAPVEGVLIGHDTYRHVRGLFTVTPRPPLRVKGKREPLRTYLVTSVRPRAFRLETRGVEGVETPMVGRDAELTELQTLLSSVVLERRARVTTVTGDAGVGKSRLLHEFLDWIELQPHDVRLLQARADQASENAPYALLRDLVFFRFEVNENDTTPIALEKIEKGFRELAGLDAAPAHLIAHLIGLSVPDSPHVAVYVGDPRLLRDHAVDAFADLVAGLAARVPVVMALEDVQWADLPSLDVIEHIVYAARSSPLLVVALGRGSLYERRPEWGAGGDRIELGPLPPEATEQLLGQVFRHLATVPADLVETIVRTAGGNPFYVEELVKTMVEDGAIVVTDDHWRVDETRAAAIRVPATLVGVLQARLDRLPAPERGVLQRASVVGPVFWDGAISAAHGEAADGHASPPGETLARLAEREMIVKHHDSSFAGTREYGFKHAILHEVTYESVLKRRRRGYHHAVAEWFLTQPDHDARAAVIAGHFERAGAHQEAARWFVRAATQARLRYANDDALMQYERALELGVADDRLLYEAYDGLGEVLTLRARYDEALATHREFLELAKTNGDPAAQASALTGISIVQLRLGATEAAHRAANEALALLRQQSDPSLASLEEALRLAAWAALHLGDLTRARLLAEEARAANEALGDTGGLSRSLNLLGLIAASSGDHVGSARYVEAALELDRAVGDRRSEGASLINLGEAARMRGDYEEAAERYREALEIQGELGDDDMETLSLSNLGGALVGLGRWRDAVESLEAAVERFEASGAVEHLSETHRFLAEAHLGLDDPPAALDQARRALRRAEDAANPHQVGHAWRVLGRIAAQLGGEVQVVPEGTPIDIEACFRNSAESFPDSDLDRAMVFADWARAVKPRDAARAEQLWAEATAILAPLSLEHLAGGLG